jgi:hypothetical protein
LLWCPRHPALECIFAQGHTRNSTTVPFLSEFLHLMLTLLLLHCGKLAKLRGSRLKLRTHETLLMAIVFSLPWMREPPSPRPALGVWPSITTELARLTLPRPELLLGDEPPSPRMCCPASSSAPLMRGALMRTGEGLEIPLTTRVCRSTAAHPAIIPRLR